MDDRATTDIGSTDLAGHDRATLARWWLALNRFEWPADFPMAEPADGAGLTDKQKFAHPGYKRAWAAIDAAIPYPGALAYREPARGAAVLSGGPAAGVEVSLGAEAPPRLVVETGTDRAGMTVKVTGDITLEGGPFDGRHIVTNAPAGSFRLSRYTRTDRRDARGFAVYEWDGVAEVQPAEPTGPAKAETAEPRSWRDRPAML